MIFNSVTYLTFLFGVVALYWVLPRRPRLWLIFAASLAFYAFWRVEFVALMLVSAVTDYLAAIGIDRSSSPGRRRALVGVSLTVNLGLLLYFKYLMFFTENITWGLKRLGFEISGPALDIILPLGISFYTFQTISYTIDVYRGFVKPERDFVLYSCYVTFFPQLVAGPILRAREVIHQLTERPGFSAEDIGAGTRRVLYGLFLKVVLADNIAPIVDSGFAQPVAALSAIDVWTLAFLFGFQIYFDFSAYSHIALGSARLMGIHFPENFNFPYVASSPRDFWRRWHISLSSWIRDYLYLPLAGARVHDRSTGGLANAVDTARPADTEQSGKSARALSPTRALFVTWAVMGLWHGANWTFVLWGLYHATFIFGYRTLAPALARVPARVGRWGGWAVTLPLAMLSWIAFRADSLEIAFGMYAHVLDPRRYLQLGLRENDYLLAALLLVAMVGAYLAQSRLVPLLRAHRVVWAVTESVTLGATISLVFVFLRPIKQFIYFQF